MAKTEHSGKPGEADPTPESESTTTDSKPMTTRDYAALQKKLKEFGQDILALRKEVAALSGQLDMDRAVSKSIRGDDIPKLKEKLRQLLHRITVAERNAVLSLERTAGPIAPKVLKRESCTVAFATPADAGRSIH